MFHDTALVHMLSICIPSDILVQESYYDATEHKTVMRNVPLMKQHYCKYKGGVDLSSQQLHGLGLFRRDLKWTNRVFRGILGLIVMNCRLIYMQQKQMDVCELRGFVMELGIALAGYPSEE